MKVCVFGASGYVGASIYDELNSKWEIDVVGTYRHEPAFSNMVQLDINEPENFSQFFKQERPDVVVWAAMAGPKEYKLIDQGLIHLIAHLTPSTKLIYLSSDFVFSEGKGPYEEGDRLCTMPQGHVYSNYANAKVKAEKLIRQELTNYCILRTGPVFGINAVEKQDEHTHHLLKHLKEKKQVKYRDDLIRTFIHIDDLTKIVSGFVRSNHTGIYHIGREKPQSFYDFMKERAKTYGFDSNLVQLDEKEETMQAQPKNLALVIDRIKNISRISFK